jgi:hypothetical protein
VRHLLQQEGYVMKKERQMELEGGVALLADPVRGLLRRARETIEREGWTSHAWQDAHGQCVGNAVLGGAGERSVRTALQRAALKRLVRAIPERHMPFAHEEMELRAQRDPLDLVVNFNDHCVGSQQGALRWLDKAIAQEEVT